MALPSQLDVLVIGAGFGGLCALKHLRDEGYTIKVIDTASDVGGTWYWNRYPGAMSDSKSIIYRFSWDKDDLQTYPWSDHYVKQKEILQYFQHVATKHDLYKDIQFQTELTAAVYNADTGRWNVSLSTGQTIDARYVVTALGVLSAPNYPKIPGLETFKGRAVHTSRWPADLDLSQMRVGVIGNGSTGVQVITALAGHTKSLVSFQRHPQYSVPSGDGPVSSGYRQWANDNYDTIFTRVKQSYVGMELFESNRPYDSVPPEEAEKIFEHLWQQGNGFGFYFGGFNDIGTNRVANEHACNFIRSKIDSIVQDPEKARKLKPNELHARRPICDNGYYYAFNKPGVDIVHIGETPIVAIRENGIETTAGFHELDAIVFATGFDAVDGNYNRIRIRGRGGKSLKQYWDARERGPSAYLGASVPEFPNLLMIGGPLGPFGNYPPVVETYTELISGLLAEAERARRLPGARPGSEGTIIEATKQAEDEWTTAAENVIDSSLFKEANSWLFGNNVEGKKRAIRFHFGGLGHFYNTVHRVIDEGFSGFQPFSQNKSTTGTGADVKATKTHVEDAEVNGISNTKVDIVA